MNINYRTIYQSNINKKYTKSYTKSIIPNKICFNKHLIKITSQEIHNLNSRGYGIYDIYYDGDDELSSQVYKIPEFKTCELKKNKTDIEIFISNGYDVYDIYYDSNYDSNYDSD